jgi:hypothetical protein
MKQLGIVLILLGIVGLIYFQTAFDTSVTVDYKGTGYSKPSGFPDRVNNIGLMQDKQNYTIISLGSAIIGLILFLAGNRNKKAEDENEDDTYENETEETKTISDDTYYCKKCGHEQELDCQELENKKFYCCNCKVENII